MGIDAALNQQGNMVGDERARAAHRVTVVGAVVNLFLAVSKIAGGIWGNSQALIADGIHSISDLATDAMVIIASKHGSQDADEEHPYGHGRIETAMTVGLGVVLILVATGIAWDAVIRLFETERLLNPGWMAMAAAIASVLANEGLYHYTMHVARKVRSNLLKANAWHHRSDALSSVVVIIGVGGSMAGLTYLDSIAAVIVGFMVAKIGWDLAWHSLRELVDTALDTETVEKIRSEIESVDGVETLHMLRTRRMGADALVDVHVLVNPRCSVSEGHHISESVRRRLVRKFDDVTDVLVHVDPEDDEVAPPTTGLATRRQVLAVLRPEWETLVPPEAIERLVLHYLDGKIWLELYLSHQLLEQGHSCDELSQKIGATAGLHDEVAEVKVYYS